MYWERPDDIVELLRDPELHFTPEEFAEHSFFEDAWSRGEWPVIEAILDHPDVDPFGDMHVQYREHRRGTVFDLPCVQHEHPELLERLLAHPKESRFSAWYLWRLIVYECESGRTDTSRSNLPVSHAIMHLW